MIEQSPHCDCAPSAAEHSAAKLTDLEYQLSLNELLPRVTFTTIRNLWRTEPQSPVKSSYWSCKLRHGSVISGVGTRQPFPACCRPDLTDYRPWQVPSTCSSATTYTGLCASGQQSESAKPRTEFVSSSQSWLQRASSNYKWDGAVRLKRRR